MPIYDFGSQSCGCSFAELVRSDNFSSLGPPPGGGCCGGSCHSHSH